MIFTLENTQGYTQKELDHHNKECRHYLLIHNIDMDDKDLVKHWEDKYFNELMC